MSVGERIARCEDAHPARSRAASSVVIFDGGRVGTDADARNGGGGRSCLAARACDGAEMGEQRVSDGSPEKCSLLISPCGLQIET